MSLTNPLNNISRRSEKTSKVGIKKKLKKNIVVLENKNINGGGERERERKRRIEMAKVAS